MMVRLLRKIRLLICFIIFGLVVSGVTAFPVEAELSWLLRHPSLLPAFLQTWLQHCYEALRETNLKYPMLAYAYDWLAFAHIVIALAFIGPLKNPVQNRWIIDWAMLACAGVIPLAFVAGPIRQIPVFHILIDCSFGIVAIVPLIICRRWIRQLSVMQVSSPGLTPR
jgi:hypothetical protein